MATAAWNTIIALLVISYNKTTATPPNLLLIVADDLGYGDLSVLGHPTSGDPVLNKLAKESLMLTNFYATSPVCSPSRASLLTGLYPQSTGIWPGVLWPNSIGGLSHKYPTLATRLKRVGYATGMIGKWHLGVGQNREYLPTGHGFDQYLGVPYSHDMCPCTTCFPNEPCNDHCRPDFVSCPLFENESIIEQPAHLPTLTEKYTKTAKKFLDEHHGSPFFLYVSYHQNHHPQFANRTFQFSKRSRFGAALTEMDESIGDILKKLDETGVRNNTLVIFTSDNGPSLMRHINGGCAGLLRCGKGTTYEGGVRVPALFHWKSMIRPGHSSALFTALDVVPTFMSILGQSSVAFETHGQDLSKTIFLHHHQREHFLYSPSNLDPKIGMMAIRSERFKAHFYTEGSSLSDDTNYDYQCSSYAKLLKHSPPILYDLEADPGERYPLDPILNNGTIDALISLKDKLYGELPWAPSEMNKGQSKNAFPCCKQSPMTCKPFPKCCDC